jgi:Ca-activated chloride channel family protein
MEHPARIRFLLVPVCLATFLSSGSAQNSGSPQNSDELPSAPSAVIQQKTARPKPQSPATPVESQPPAESQQPAAISQTGDAGANDQPSVDQPSDDAAAPKPGNEERPTIHRTVNEVNVVFTVTDKHNRYIKDLSKNDFKVIDDEKAVEDIRSFRRESDLPLQVGLLIDASNSIRDRFKFEQEAAIEFLNQTIRPKYDQAFVVGFDTEFEVTQDFTDSTEALSKGVRALRPGGGTAMYDAIYRTCREKLLKSAQTIEVRRAIILVSDGEDNYSRVTRDEAIEMALRANVIVYTISTNFPSGGDGDKVLQRIADATGGRAFQPFQLSDVANAFARIQDDLRSQYALSYRPAEFHHDGRYRTIEITAQNRKGLKVRSRHGYYAPAAE